MHRLLRAEREKSIEAGVALSSRERVIAAVEVLLGAAVVIGHNVFRVLPNEVPMLVAILWVSLLIRRKPWSTVGVCRPFSWKLTMIAGVSAGVVLQLKEFITEPLAHLLWHQQENVSSVIAGIGHHGPGVALRALAIVWTFAAFGEEFAYRALLLRRTADALNGTRAAYLIAALFSSCLFGFGHFYKGPTGIFDSTVSGLILAAAYLLTRRNVWASVIGHGISDTIAVLFTYLGG